MGPLASAKRSHSFDLADSSPNDDVIMANRNHGKVRGIRSKTAFSSKTPIRLMWSRPRSSDVGGGQAAITQFRGVNVESSVLQNGQRSWSRELKQLLADTQPVRRWQEPLKSLLQAYLIPTDAFLALRFLIENMDTAISASRNPAESLGFPSIFVDVKHKPIIFNVDHWKRIMIALHFELTEAGSGLDLGLIEVTLTRHVTEGSLLGFKLLLQCLSSISGDMLRMLLNLTVDEGHRFMTVLQDVQHDHRNGPKDTAILKELYARNPDQMSALGFHQTKVRLKKEVIWHPDKVPSNILNHVEVALIGLFHSGGGLETYV